MFDAMGFAHVATHRSKDVTLHRQGDVNLILNAEKDAFAHSFFLLHGPSVCALAFRVDDARSAVERALRYKAQTFRGKVGPNELVIPAIRGLEGSLIYLVDRAAHGTIYDVDFVAEPAAGSRACGLTKVDHVSQVMPRGKLDGTLAVLQIRIRLRGRAGARAGRSVRADPEPRAGKPRPHRAPAAQRDREPAHRDRALPASYGGGGVHHIAIATDDIFRTMAEMRARKVPLLDIPETYYDGLSAHARPATPERIERMRSLAHPLRPLRRRANSSTPIRALSTAASSSRSCSGATMTASARSMPRCGSPRRR